MRNSRIALLGAASLAAGLSTLVGVGSNVLSRDEAPKMPPPTKKKTKRRRAKAAPSYLTAHGKYIPGGEHRNCGDNGISPKSVKRRVQANAGI